jgi:hypothetical protein
VVLLRQLMLDATIADGAVIDALQGLSVPIRGSGDPFLWHPPPVFERAGEGVGVKDRLGGPTAKRP